MPNLQNFSFIMEMAGMRGASLAWLDRYFAGLNPAGNV
jgi:hypothetical protein